MLQTRRPCSPDAAPSSTTASVPARLQLLALLALLPLVLPAATSAALDPTPAAAGTIGGRGHGDAIDPSPADAVAFWGCEAAALPPGAIHVVVSTFNAEPEQLLPWIWHLGLTNAAIYVYHRLNDSAGAIAAMYGVSGSGGSTASASGGGGAASAVRLPCNMSLRVLPLLPNKGREAAVFLHHIVKHYDRLPQALMLVHDHGPASRHSLCGPFYRRARGYYRGLLERAAAKAAAARGEAAGKLGLFGRFAGMVATLSSGCVETWARGCCAAFICSGAPGACPFAPDNCTAPLADPHSTSGPTPGVRQYYLHANGLYDARYENQVVLGPEPVAVKGDGGSGGGGGGGGGLVTAPVALLRYVGAAHSSTDMWDIAHEYPPATHRLTKNETLELLKDLLARHDFRRKKRTNFKSCCASLLLRDAHVRRWPIELYRELMEYSMDPIMDYEATKAVSGPGWALWADRDYGQSDVLDYMRVDIKLKSIQGCPAQRYRPLAALAAQMRARAAAATAAAAGRAAAGGAADAWG